jgi:hypothetical protein
VVIREGLRYILAETQLTTSTTTQLRIRRERLQWHKSRDQANKLVMKENVMRSEVMMVLTERNGRSSDDAEATSTGPMRVSRRGNRSQRKYQPTSPRIHQTEDVASKSLICMLNFSSLNLEIKTEIHSSTLTIKEVSITHVNLLTLDTASFLRNHSESGIILCPTKSSNATTTAICVLPAWTC